MAGQGMNASMNDTHNLSWKLAHVLKGWARPSLLHTYEFERRKYAQDLIEFDRQYSTLYSGKLLTDTGGKMDRQVHMELIKTFGKFAGFTSGIHIQYAPSRITQAVPHSAARSLVIGQRMPSQLVVRILDGRPFELQDLLPADGRWKIILFPGNTCAVADSDDSDASRLSTAAQGLYGLLAHFAKERSVEAMFSIIQVSATSGGFALEDAMESPLAGVCVKQHFIDQREINGQRGGEAYKCYGVVEPAVVVVRPDGSTQAESESTVVGTVVSALSQIMEVITHTITSSNPAPTLDGILSSQSMLLPSLSSLLSDESTPEAALQPTPSFDPHAPATSPPVQELWLVVLSHSLHIIGSGQSGEVTIAQVLRTMQEFWTSNVPLTWEGYSACKRRAKKDRIQKEGKDKVEKETNEQGDSWKFTWWESVDANKKKDGNKDGNGKWEEPKVDGSGNARLVLRGFEVFSSMLYINTQHPAMMESDYLCTAPSAPIDEPDDAPNFLRKSTMYTNLALILGCLLFSVLYLLRKNSKSSRYPPTPPGWPLLGNLLEMPTTEEWVQYKQWGQDLKSDIIHLNACGTHIIVLNSLETVTDLLEKRSTIYSDRPAAPMMHLMGFSWAATLMPANAQWKAQRRHFRHGFDGGAIKRHYSSITSAAHDLLRRYIEQPESWRKSIRHMVGATIADVTYGIKVLPDNDPYIKTAEAVFAAAAQALIPGTFLVDMIPALKYVPAWVPGAGFKRKAREWKKDVDEIYEAPFVNTKTAMNAEIQGNLESEERHIQAAAAGMYTVTFLETFTLAMLTHPEVQKRAQAELDAVLGSDRLPTFADQESLPYLAAVIKECWRWEVVSPLAIPHLLAADDEYKGYFLPKGAIVIANAWQILNDEDAYPDPSAFRPERFLKDGKLDPSVRNPTSAGVFGWGRRIWRVLSPTHIDGIN
ncbi:hypothetical protein HWV62_4247 [Athelia sp. TMB]|nr:hypothetical protein HWV62_4247 [Athelia sp. TMB]